MSLLYIQASGVLPSTFSNNFSSEAVRAIISILILHLKVGDKKLFLFFTKSTSCLLHLFVSQMNYLQVIAVFEIKQLTSTQ